MASLFAHVSGARLRRKTAVNTPPAGGSSRAAHNLLPRDLRVIQLVARFGQLSANHIRELLFSDVTAAPANRSLRRLTEAGYLHRIERRLVGGARGGSGQYVYELGNRGHYLLYEGRYEPSRNVRFHALAIADTYVQLVRLERAGLIELVGLSTEPDCWYGDVRPDMRVDLYRKRTESTLIRWIEVDMGTQSQRVLKDKLEAYWKAYSDAEADDWPEFPRIIFTVVDEPRAKELAWLIGQLKPERRELFIVTTFAMFPTLFM